jgi:cytochrome P450
MILLDLFSAGAESVANSLDYSLLYLLLNPHIQNKVHEELDRVIGRSRRPSLDDRARYEQSKTHPKVTTCNCL